MKGFFLFNIICFKILFVGENHDLQHQQLHVVRVMLYVFNCHILWGDDVRSLIPSVLCPCVGSERAVARKEPLETLHKSRKLQNKHE